MDGDGPCSEIMHDIIFGRLKYRTCLNILRLSEVKPHRSSSIQGVVGGKNSEKFPGKLQSPIYVRGKSVIRRFGAIKKYEKRHSRVFHPCLGRFWAVSALR